MRKNFITSFIVISFFLTLNVFANTSTIPVVSALKNTDSTIIWKPTVDFSELFQQCLTTSSKENGFSKKQKNYIRCVSDYMSKHNASTQAIAFFKTTQGWATQYQPYGKVSLVFAKIVGADYQDRYFFITPRGEVIDTEIVKRPTPQSLAKQLPTFAALLKQSPAADIYGIDANTPKVTVTPDKGQQFVFTYRIATCHACERIGTLSQMFSFKADGSFSGIKATEFVAGK